MTIQTFDPMGEVNIGPDNGLGFTEKPKVNTVSFGDGYIQRTADGINNIPQKADIRFTNVTGAEKDYVLEFFREHKGYIAFLWTFPGHGTEKKWIATEWNVIRVAYDVYIVEAKIEQVYS